MDKNRTKPHNASLKHADVAVGELVAAPEALSAARPEQRLAVLEEGGQEVGEEVRDEAVLLLVTLRPEHGNPLCKVTLTLTCCGGSRGFDLLMQMSSDKFAFFEGRNVKNHEIAPCSSCLLPHC